MVDDHTHGTNEATLDEFKRDQATVLKVIGESRFGSFLGVQIDLRHPALDPGLWHPQDQFFHRSMDDMRLRGAVFEFPNEPPYVSRFNQKPDRSKLPSDVREALDKLDDEDDPGTLEVLKQATADLYEPRARRMRLQLGDQVEIAKVYEEHVGPSTVHPADRLIRFAELQVRRGHELIETDVELEFRQRGSLLPTSPPTQNYFDVLAERVQVYLGIEDLNSYVLLGESLTTEEAALYSAQQALERYRAVCATFEEPPKDGLEHWARQNNTEEMLHNAAAFGFFLAQAEAERYAGAAANRGLTVVEGARTGGRSSGEVRKAKSEVWKQEVRRMALEMSAAGNARDQWNMAMDINHGWKLRDQGGGEVAAPSMSSIQSVLTEMRKAKEISFSKEPPSL